MRQTEAFDLESRFLLFYKPSGSPRNGGVIPTYIVMMVLAILLLTTGCDSKGRHDFSAVEKIICSEPRAALDSLDAIDDGSLSEPDRHYYDFLLIKARDKAYVKHRSDSLILDVIRYYEGRDDRNLYPEALYYGGRVYCDIGDYPTALKYFQKALDKYPANSTDLVRVNILSQMGGLFQDMELPLDAVPYLKEAIEIGKVLRDTVNLVYDNQLLGSIYMAARMYDKAESQFNEAHKWAENVSDKRYSDELMANVQTYKAALMWYRDSLDSALSLIHGVESRVEPEYRNYAYISAAHIYLEAGRIDSAYKYARLLVGQRDSNNRELGYRVLLNPKLRDRISTDSLLSYVVKYRDILEDYRRHHQLQQLYVQNARYNYMVQQRERHNAERKADRLAIIVLAMALAATVVTFCLYARWQKHRLELTEARMSISNLEKRIRDMENCEEERLERSRFDKIKSNNERRALLKTRLLSIYKKNVDRPVAVSESLYGSEVYNRLMGRINEGKHIPESDLIWEELGKTVLEERPDFRHDLEVLSGGKLGVNDWHVALLIRCGVTPTQMTKVFSRSRSTVSHYRRKLLSLVLSPVKNKDRDGHNPSDDELNPSVDDHNTIDDDYSTSVDDIIRLL